MRAYRQSTLIAILTLAAILAATAESSRSPTPGPPPGTIISGRTKVKSKPKPVRKALEARYAAISEAYRLKDPNAVLRMRTEDFHAILPSGQIWDAAASAQYTRAGFAQAETTLALTFGIGRIEVQGDTAAAEIDQHWVRRQQKGGALRFVDTRAHQRETWVRRGNEWLLWRVDQVNPGPWIVDGKQVDPSKPYGSKRLSPNAF
jgi:ketosteroid isomerase-like protein